MRKATKSLLLVAVAAFGLGACSDDVTVVEPQPPEPPPPEDAELTIQSVENLQGDLVDPDSVAGKIAVVLNVEAGDQEISEIQISVDGEARTCQTLTGAGGGTGASVVAGGQQAQQAATVKCVLNTAALEGFEQCTGQAADPEFDNGEHAIGAQVVLSDGATIDATNTVTLNFQNQNTLVIERTSGTGVVGNGVRYFGGEDIAFAACPVVFEGDLEIGSVGLAGSTAAATANVADDGDADAAAGDVDFGAGTGALVSVADTFRFTAAVANNQGEVEDDPAAAGHTIGGSGQFQVTTDDGEDVSDRFVSQAVNLFLDFTGPVVNSGGTSEVTIGGQPIMNVHYSAGDFSVSNVSDLGVGVGAIDIDVTDSGGNPVEPEAPGDTAMADTLPDVGLTAVEQLPEDDLNEYTASADSVTDRLGNVNVPATPVTGANDFGVDKTAPQVTGQDPPADTAAADSLVISGDSLLFFATDPDLASGDPGSGIDVAAITAQTDATSLPVTQTAADTFEVDISGLSDGQFTVVVDVPDLAVPANVATAGATFDFILDRTPPSVNLSNPPPATVDVQANDVTFTIAGSATDEVGIESVTLNVRDAGGDDACQPSDTLVPVGTNPGEIDDNQIDLTASADAFSQDVTIQNPAPGGATTPETYCFFVDADDLADNVGTDFAQTQVNWNP